MARAIGHPYTVAETLCVAAMYHQIAGDLDQLRPLAEEAVALAETCGFDGLLAAGNIFLAFCRVKQRGEPAQARLIRRNLQLYAGNYGMLFLPYFHGVLAEAYLALKDYAAALRTARRALEMVDRFGEEWSRAPLLDIRAEAAAGCGLATASEIDI